MTHGRCHRSNEPERGSSEFRSCLYTDNEITHSPIAGITGRVSPLAGSTTRVLRERGATQYCLAHRLPLREGGALASPSCLVTGAPAGRMDGRCRRRVATEVPSPVGLDVQASYRVAGETWNMLAFALAEPVEAGRSAACKTGIRGRRQDSEQLHRRHLARPWRQPACSRAAAQRRSLCPAISSRRSRP